MEIDYSKICPVCQSNAGVIQVQLLYFNLQEKDHKIISKYSITREQKAKLISQIAPPFLDRQPIWRILNPDILFGMIVLILVLMTLFLFLDEKTTWINNLYLLGLLGIIYLPLRKRFFVFFYRNLAERTKLLEAAKMKADLWGSAFYCFEDKIIFSPETNKTYTMTEFQAIMQQ